MAEETRATTAAAAEPSGPKDETPHNAPPTEIHSSTPENKDGVINPSAPEDSNATPGSTASAQEIK